MQCTTNTTRMDLQCVSLSIASSMDVHCAVQGLFPVSQHLAFKMYLIVFLAYLVNMYQS
jgi:hypothetical protein